VKWLINDIIFLSLIQDKDRRPLHILQRAADNNEILVGADRIIKSTHQLKGAKL
jgi:hypothetical protein